MLPRLAAIPIYQSGLKLESKCDVRGYTCTLKLPTLSADGLNSEPLFKTPQLLLRRRTLVTVVPNDPFFKRASRRSDLPDRTTCRRLFTRSKKKQKKPLGKDLVPCLRMITGCVEMTGWESSPTGAERLSKDTASQGNFLFNSRHTHGPHVPPNCHKSDT